MDLNKHKGVLVAVGVGLVAVVAASLGALSMAIVRPGGSATPAPPPIDYAAVALEKCDGLASDPDDPNRFGAPVADAGVAAGAAALACEEAVRLNPSVPRAKYQLGRAYWVAGRDAEALANFVEAASSGQYAAALKRIGDAYLEGRGLPAGEEMNAVTALKWYQEAKAAGHPAGQAAVAEAEDLIRRSEFDPSRFQSPKHMAALYYGNFENYEYPVALAYYAQGLVQGMDSEQTIFMDMKCKPLVNIIGKNVLNAAVVGSYLVNLAKGGDSGEDFALKATETAFQHAFRQIPLDEGQRDAALLFDREIYGCDSPVTRTIMKNIMFRANGQNASTLPDQELAVAPAAK